MHLVFSIYSVGGEVKVDSELDEYVLSHGYRYICVILAHFAEFIITTGINNQCTELVPSSKLPNNYVDSFYLIVDSSSEQLVNTDLIEKLSRFDTEERNNLYLSILSFLYGICSNLAANLDKGKMCKS